MIGGIKEIKAMLGCEMQFERLFNELKQIVRAEESGNLYYDLYQVPNQPGHYRVMERYIDQAALDAHHHSAHGKKYFPKIRALLESLSVEYFESVE